MESAIVLSTDDVKHIIAKYFGVEQSKVIKSQYYLYRYWCACSRDFCNTGGKR